MHDQVEKDPLEAPAEKGRLFAQEAVRQVAPFVPGMMDRFDFLLFYRIKT
jgi:hypothetical protein